MSTKARELQSNMRLAKPYVKPNMTGRVSHDAIWRRAMARWQPGLRVTVAFEKGQ